MCDGVCRGNVCGMVVYRFSPQGLKRNGESASYRHCYQIQMSQLHLSPYVLSSVYLSVLPVL